MACCGRSVRVSPLAMPASQDTGPVLFEHQEGGSLTVYGRVTGRRYHFASRGARVYVDGRDAPVLDVTRGVAIVRAAAVRPE